MYASISNYSGKEIPEKINNAKLDKRKGTCRITITKIEV